MRVSVFMKLHDGVLYEKNGPKTKARHAALAKKSYTVDFFSIFCKEKNLPKKIIETHRVLSRTRWAFITSGQSIDFSQASSGSPPSTWPYKIGFYYFGSKC